MKNSIGLLGVLLCLVGCIFAICNNPWWFVFSCIGLMLSIVKDNE